MESNDSPEIPDGGGRDIRYARSPFERRGEREEGTDSAGQGRVEVKEHNAMYHKQTIWLSQPRGGGHTVQ